MDWKNMIDKELNKTVDSSKKLWYKARDRAKELGDQSILSLEVRQLDARHADLLTKLGSRVYELLVEEKRSTVSAKSAGVKELLEEIRETKDLIEEKRGELNEESSKEEDKSDEKDETSGAKEEAWTSGKEKTESSESEQKNAGQEKADQEMSGQDKGE